MQEDLDSYLNHYSRERTHQSRDMNGRVPYQAFLDGIVPYEAEAEAIEEAA